MTNDLTFSEQDLPEPEPFNMDYPYGQSPYSKVRPNPKLRPLNGFAIVSFCLSLFWFSIPAIIVGHVASYQLSFIGFERGKGLARFGTIYGYLQLIAGTIFFIWFGIHIVLGIIGLVSAFATDPSTITGLLMGGDPTGGLLSGATGSSNGSSSDDSASKLLNQLLGSSSGSNGLSKSDQKELNNLLKEIASSSGN